MMMFQDTGSNENRVRLVGNAWDLRPVSLDISTPIASLVLQTKSMGQVQVRRPSRVDTRLGSGLSSDCCWSGWPNNTSIYFVLSLAPMSPSLARCSLSHLSASPAPWTNQVELIGVAALQALEHLKQGSRVAVTGRLARATAGNLFVQGLQLQLVVDKAPPGEGG